jgi:hypothetical protein
MFGGQDSHHGGDTRWTERFTVSDRSATCVWREGPHGRGRAGGDPLRRHPRDRVPPPVVYCRHWGAGVWGGGDSPRPSVRRATVASGKEGVPEGPSWGREEMNCPPRHQQLTRIQHTGHGGTGVAKRHGCPPELSPQQQPVLWHTFNQRCKGGKGREGRITHTGHRAPTKSRTQGIVARRASKTPLKGRGERTVTKLPMGRRGAGAKVYVQYSTLQ